MSLSQIHDDIAASGQSECSKRTHISRLKRLSQAPGWPNAIVSTCVPSVSRNGKHAHTLALYRTILSVCSFSETLRDLIDEQRREIAMETDKLAQIYDKERLEEGKRDSDVSWEWVQSVENRFPMCSQGRLLYLLYCKLPSGVQRADFSPMKVVSDRSECTDDRMNYLIKNDCSCIFNEYKTSRRYGQKVVQIPRDVLDELGPGEWVFDNGFGDPVDPNTLSKLVSRNFKRYTGVHVTINTLRRSWADYTMRNATSEDEERKAALDSDHCHQMHRFYAGRTAEDKYEYHRSYMEEKGRDTYYRRNVLRNALKRGSLPTRKSILKYKFSKEELLPIVESLVKNV